MPRHSRLWEFKRLVQVADADLPIFTEQVQEPKTDRVGERLERLGRLVEASSFGVCLFHTLTRI